MKLFQCKIGDQDNIFDALLTANSEEELKSHYSGEHFIEVKDVTSEYFTEDSVNALYESLRATNWGLGETRLLCALLEEHIRGSRK